MNTTTETNPLDDHLRPAGKVSSDPDYLAFKNAKIKAGLSQANDRSRMIPASEVWEELGLER